MKRFNIGYYQTVVQQDFLNAEKGDIVLFKFSVPGHFHWSSASPECDGKKYCIWSKDFEYIVRIEFFLPEAYRHTWRSSTSPQKKKSHESICQGEVLRHVSTKNLGAFDSLHSCSLDVQ